MRYAVSLAVCLLALAACPGWAQEAPAPARIAEKIPLKHQGYQDIIALLTGNPDLKVGNRIGANVVPQGIGVLLGLNDDNSLLAKGTPDAVRLVRDEIRLVDVPAEERGNGEVRLTLTPLYALPGALRAQILALPHAGTVTVQGRSLTLEGRRDWLFLSMNASLRAELDAASVDRREP